MKNHTDLLNLLAKRYNLNHYLEIGLQNRAANFDKIICEHKYSIDPDEAANADYKGTSDNFFRYNFNPVRMFSLIFIDGLHHAGQVKKDFDSSLKYLMPGGFIVIHDCWPISEDTTHVPRDQKIWHGDVYKFCMRLCEYDGIDFRTWPYDEGCCVVWKDSAARGFKLGVPICWEEFTGNRDLLRPVEDISNVLTLLNDNSTPCQPLHCQRQ